MAIQYIQKKGIKHTKGQLNIKESAMKLKEACSLEGKLDQPRQHIEKQTHYFANKGPSSQGYGFSSGHVWM